VAKRIAIVQSSYIPWKGYFDLIASVDEFVLYDDAQYTKRDWRNRNRIKTRQGPLWLTIPVVVKGRFDQRVCDTMASECQWPEKHWRSIRTHYSRAPCFSAYGTQLEELFLGTTSRRLSDINYRFLAGLSRMLGIDTRFSWSMDYKLGADRTGKLVSICHQAGATEYISGPSARSYLDEQQFADVGIAVSYADYSAYPEYAQLYPPFDHYVSIIDLLVHTGSSAVQFMQSVSCRRDTAS
jgi:hypothetical protein